MAKDAEKEIKKDVQKQIMPKDYVPRLKKLFKDKIIPALMQEINCTSPMAVPRLQKIVINIGVTDAKENIQFLEQAKEDISLITGQFPCVRRAKKSISNFKLRKGMPIGVKVTLRGARMYEFFDRFVSIAVPRIRDFQGFESKGFDGTGNFNIGLKEQYIFPEINIEKSPKARGMNITFVTTAGNNEKAKLLLEHLGMPFKKDKKVEIVKSKG